MVPTFTLLTLAVLALWLGAGDRVSVARRNFWLLPWIGSLVTALASGIVQPIGLGWIAALVGTTFWFAHPPVQRWQRIAAGAALLALAAGLMLHRLPGFNNPRVISAVRFSADAIPFTLYLNYDKTLVGLFILGWCHSRLAHVAEWRAMLATAAPRAGCVIAVIFVLSLAMGYVRFELKFPPVIWLWLWVNLCFTCLAEEALFRGFIQAQLQHLWRRWSWGTWLALGVAAGLFGLAHAAGGAAYVALATVAGLGYGWVYQRTQRIEASILTHFALNTAHFLAFTYPALQPSA